MILILLLQLGKCRLGLLCQKVAISKSIYKEQKEQQQSKNNGPQYKVVGSFADKYTEERNTVFFLGNTVQFIGRFLPNAGNETQRDPHRPNT